MQTIEIIASDNTPLAATWWAATTPTAAASILICPGTGIPRGFYKGFGTWLSEQGYNVLSFDYRGIAGSRRGSLKGDKTTKQDWGRLDMSAALETLKNMAPTTPTWVIGHSIGGQLLALVKGIEEVDGVITVGTSFGYWGHMPGMYRWFVFTLWYVVIPLLTSILGYLPAKSLSLGEDLPSGVALEWARWGKQPDYFTKEISHEPGFANLRVPWSAILLADDKIATLKNALPLYNLYPNADIQVKTIVPEEEGLSQIGHLGFFSRKNAILWPHVTTFIQANPPLETT